MSTRTLHYPKIPTTRDCPAGRCIAFEKYDGTNLHWCWNRDFGWHAFGTRRDEFNLTEVGIREFVCVHPDLCESVGVFQTTLADGIEEVFRTNSIYQNCEDVKVFTEFFGPRSFAGLHKADDPKELKLIDVWIDGYGMVGPRQFLSHFGQLRIARVVYRGKLTGQFAEDVRNGRYGIGEGVVCKGGAGGDDLWMAKIKTYAYLDRLKQAYGDRWEQYWE